MRKSDDPKSLFTFTSSELRIMQTLGEIEKLARDLHPTAKDRKLGKAELAMILRALANYIDPLYYVDPTKARPKATQP